MKDPTDVHTGADNMNGRAPREVTPARHRGGTLDARTTLRPPRPVRERLAALMLDLRHEAAAAYPDLAAWVAFLDAEGKAELTLYNYSRQIAMLLREYPDTPFAEITADQLNAALAQVPQRSRYITRSIWNCWFGWGEIQERLDRNPMRKVARPRHPHRRPKDIYAEGEIALLEAVPSPDGPLCTLLFASGIRKAGARNLRRSDIDLDRARMVVTEKGSKTRIIPLPGEALQAVADLDLLERLKPTDYLWYGRPGGRTVISRRTPIGGTTFDSWWTRVTKAAGVRRLNPHQTRHTYAQRLREKGATVEVRQVLMGHESIRTTVDQYGRVSVEDAAAVIAEVW